MALGKNDPRRYQRPVEGADDADAAVLPPGGGGKHTAYEAWREGPKLVAKGRARVERNRKAARAAKKGGEGAGGATGVAGGAGTAAARPPPPPDKARAALLAVLAVRGKPINRKRGMKPSPAFQRAAGAYIIEHHYNFCIQFARQRAARHVPLADLVQACLLGAYTALERYDTEHETSYRFLSYAKWYLLCETNKLLHKEECLVVVPPQVKEARGKLALTCPQDISDEDAAELLGMHVADVRAARTAHLGHEHRVVDERNRTVRRTLGEVRQLHDDHAATFAAHDGLEEALAQLGPVLRGVLHAEFGVGAAEPGVPQPSTSESRRALRNLALRKLRELLED